MSDEREDREQDIELSDQERDDIRSAGRSGPPGFVGLGHSG